MESSILMHPIEDRIEDAYVDAMDILYRTLGRDDSSWYLHLFGAMRDVTVAALRYQGFLAEPGPQEAERSGPAAEQLQEGCLRLIALLEGKQDPRRPR